MFLAKAGASVSVPRSLRIRFWLLRAARWLVPAERCLIFPLAETRNRFFVPLCVFCLGMAVFPNRVVYFAFGGIHQSSNFGAGWKG